MMMMMPILCSFIFITRQTNAQILINGTNFKFCDLSQKLSQFDWYESCLSPKELMKKDLDYTKMLHSETKPLNSKLRIQNVFVLNKLRH